MSFLIFIWHLHSPARVNTSQLPTKTTPASPYRPLGSSYPHIPSLWAEKPKQGHEVRNETLRQFSSFSWSLLDFCVMVYLCLLCGPVLPAAAAPLWTSHLLASKSETATSPWPNDPSGGRRRRSHELKSELKNHFTRLTFYTLELFGGAPWAASCGCTSWVLCFSGSALTDLWETSWHMWVSVSHPDWSAAAVEIIAQSFFRPQNKPPLNTWNFNAAMCVSVPWCSAGPGACCAPCHTASWSSPLFWRSPWRWTGPWSPPHSHPPGPGPVRAGGSSGPGRTGLDPCWAGLCSGCTWERLYTEPSSAEETEKDTLNYLLLFSNLLQLPQTSPSLCFKHLFPDYRHWISAYLLITLMQNHFSPNYLFILLNNKFWISDLKQQITKVNREQHWVWSSVLSCWSSPGVVGHRWAFWRPEPPSLWPWGASWSWAWRSV